MKKSRPPIITILGHVDHGKTTLLDYIRKSHVADREHGGITQSIGAYEITVDTKDYETDRITFIDTPGHEAFTKLRARGANIADIALLIVDAKDSLKPQTVESISHIKAAKIPFIVVANKIDLPDANTDRIQIDLLKHEVMVEQKGGKVPMIGISAKTGDKVDELLETILLLASEQHYSYEPDAPTQGYILETKKDRRGIVASVVVKNGTISLKDALYAEDKKCVVRALIDDQGKQRKSVSPSTPFELLGFSEMPLVGSALVPTSKEKAEEKKVEKAAFTIDTILGSTEPEEKKLSLIIKADTKGSLEAIEHALEGNDTIQIDLAAVGDINNSDIFLAQSSKAIVIGFNIKPNAQIQQAAKQEKVIIKTYNIIYEIIDELTEVAALMHEKEQREKNSKGEAKVAATFIIEGQKAYGVRITKGKASNGDKIELYRNGEVVGTSRLVSLRYRAKTVAEAKKDQEAGMVFEPALDAKVGDMIKFIL